MTTYRIQPNVSAEVFAEEVLVIHLASGHYHSFRQAGVPLWSLLTQGHSVESAAAALAQPGTVPLDTVLKDTRSFLQSLVENDLVAPFETNSAPPTLPLSTIPYAPPLVERYTDMQELLAIDPIHEVDVAGWPAQPDPARPPGPIPPNP